MRAPCPFLAFAVLVPGKILVTRRYSPFLGRIIYSPKYAPQLHLPWIGCGGICHGGGVILAGGKVVETPNIFPVEQANGERGGASRELPHKPTPSTDVLFMPLSSTPSNC